MKDILIRNVHILDPVNNRDETGDILIRDGRFASSALADDTAQIIDGTGLTAAPGLVDLHVHLRDPGQTHKDAALQLQEG